MTASAQADPLRVLIIDDDHAIGKVLLAHVKAAGHEGRFTDSPETFLSLHREWRPHFVVVDLVMEQMDGLDVLSRLAEDACEAAVIISSGMGHRVLDAAKRFADANGLAIAGLLSKPYRRADLESLLREPRHLPTGSASFSDERIDEWIPGDFEGAFRAALEDGQVRVAYQPKVACGSGELVGYEALARWTHPEQGVIGPDTFVPMAERVGLVASLTDLVLREALDWFAGQNREAHERMSVNISASEFTDPHLNARLMAACQQAGLAPDRVILELTETSAMEDPILSLQLLTRLRLDGFHVSLDDFGTGYSSMLQLARLPFSELKVDRSFVATATTSEESAVVIRSMLDLGHALGLDCTAEGVEDEGVLNLLDDLGCDFAQGYHIGLPMLPEAIATWAAPSRS